MTAFYNEHDKYAAQWLRLTTLARGLPVGSAYDQAADGMSDKAPIPFPATACLRNYGARPFVRAQACGQSRLLALRRMLHKPLAHSDSKGRSDDFASLAAALTWFSRGTRLPSGGGANGIRELTSRYLRADTPQSTATYCAALSRLQTICRSVGNCGRPQPCRRHWCAGTRPCICQSSICGESVRAGERRGTARTIKATVFPFLNFI